MTTLKQYITRQHRASRASKTRRPRRPMRESADDVQTVSSLGFDAASIMLPANVDLDDRATRMNAFWEKLVDYQHRDVLVVALAVDGRTGVGANAVR